MSAEEIEYFEGKIKTTYAQELIQCRLRFCRFYGLEITFGGREHISLYVFNQLMLSNYVESALPRHEIYNFQGPQLGLYSDTADPREGPFVNHRLEKIELEIFYEFSGKTISIKGMADLANSGFDEYWYKGSKTGFWNFELKFIIPNKGNTGIKGFIKKILNKNS
jgi:hypothetical protein